MAKEIKIARNQIYKPRSAGYCELQNLLWFSNPWAYNSGVYGWNFDVYDAGDFTICTGYRSMPGKRLDHCREYDDKARAILESNLNFDEKREKINALLDEFVKINL